MSERTKVTPHVCLDRTVAADLRELAKRKNSSFSAQLNQAARLYVRQAKGETDDIILAPVIERLLGEKFDQLEAWLRPGLWGGATYSATATLLLLELLCGQSVDPAEAKTHLDLIRGRAWKMVRKGGDAPEGGS